MKVCTMIKKYGEVVGVSYTSAGDLENTASIHFFDTEEAAEEWLHTETYRFAERELMTRSQALRFLGPALFSTLEDNYLNQ